MPRHPSQLYEVGAALLAFALIRLAQRRRIDTPGVSIGTFLVTYLGLWFVLEFWKERMEEQVLDPGTALWALERSLGVHLTTGQWLSAPLALVGILILVPKATAGRTPGLSLSSPSALSGRRYLTPVPRDATGSGTPARGAPDPTGTRSRG